MKEKFDIIGMTCSSCEAHVSKATKNVAGVNSVSVNLLLNNMVVEYDESIASSDDIIIAVNKAGYSASIAKKNKVAKSSPQELDTFAEEMKATKKRLIASIILWIPVMYLSMAHMVGLPFSPTLEHYSLLNIFTIFLLTVPIVFLNRKYFTVGFPALIRRSPNMDTLVALGATAALIYGIFAFYNILLGYVTNNEALILEYSMNIYFESAATIFTLITLGKYLESRAKHSTTKSIEKLLDLTPKEALVERNGVEVSLLVSELKVGDIIILKPGSAAPVDGVVISGSSYFDESAMTGESKLVEKREGSKIISATINKNGSLKYKATEVGEDTTISKIIALVQDAVASKAPISQLADRVSAVFVPIVIMIALIAFLVWVVLGEPVSFALNIAISVLVISCPCALGLATPVAIMVSIGRASEYQILIKSAEALEAISKVHMVAFDKTGTITKGEFEVTKIEVLKYDEARLIELAASLESHSEHPLAYAIIARNGAKPLLNVSGFTSYEGLGVKGEIEAHTYLLGNRRLLEEKGVELSNISSFDIGTRLFLAEDGDFIGSFLLEDTIREDARRAVNRLKEMNIESIILTGDNEAVAKNIAEKSGVKEYYAELMPNDKYAIIEKLSNKGGIAMVGDGVNDAPALAKADVGISLGSARDIAILSSEIVLAKNSLIGVSDAVKLGRATMKNISMNLFWAFFYNVICIPIAAGVFYYAIPGLKLNPMIASACMSLSSFFVVMNALRLNFVKLHKKEEIKEEIININGGEIMKKTMIVHGMNCNHCKMSVEKALSSVSGVEGASVDLEAKTADIVLNSEVNDDVLMAAVKEAGFEPIEVK